MKPIWILVCAFFLIGCSDKNEPELVQLINEISAFDVGNEGNATDIVVKFGIEGIGGISELRIMVIPAIISEDFTKREALELSSNSYTSFSTSSDLSYLVRLSGISDVEGNGVSNNKEYVVKILMVGDGFNQLSILESNLFTLTDQGIYSGYYEGIWGLHSPCPATVMR